MASEVRKKSNLWLKPVCEKIKGDVLSIGSASDGDKMGSTYKEYFSQANSYTTSEVSAKYNCDLVLDVTNMYQIKDSTYDCVFCSGVLEHVFEFHKGINEITRVLKSGGYFVGGVPFKQAIHLPPTDYWRFTKYAIQSLLQKDYEILEIVGVGGNTIEKFPETYLFNVRKK